MKKDLLALVIINLTMAAALAVDPNSQKIKNISKLERLVFASCNKHTKRQSLWTEIARQSPNIFIWGGDNVYADGKDVDHISAAYDIQNNVPEYKEFKTVTPIIGIWDDHDYGKNNGGSNYESKKISQLYLLDFLEEPLLSPRRSQEGIYTSYQFGTENQIVKIILLDNRYFKNIVKGALLGKSQWDWLEQEIKQTPAALLFIVSGISVLSPKTIHSEEWIDYPEEKKRLKKLLVESGIPYLYLTGDKHFADIFTQEDELEFLSSGMTHNSERAVRPWIRSQYPAPIFEHNYGLIDISWTNDIPVLSLSIRGEEGRQFSSKNVRWKKTHWTEE